MKNKNVWVTGNPSNGYRVKSEGASRAASKHDTQKEAIEAAKQIAKNRGAEVIIQNITNGQIRSKDSYDNESPVRDTEN